MPKATALNDDDKKALNAWFDALSSDDQAAFLLGKHMLEAARVALKDLCASTISLANACTAKIKGVMFLKTTRGTEEQRETARAKAQEQVMKAIEWSKSQTDRKRKLREELIVGGGEVPMTAFNKKMKAARDAHRASGAAMATFKPNEQRRTKHADDKKTFGVDKDGFSKVPRAVKERKKAEADKKTYGVDEKGFSKVPRAENKRAKLIVDKETFGVNVNGESNVPRAEKARTKHADDKKTFGVDKDGFSKVPRVVKERKKAEADKKAGKRSRRQLVIEAERAVECDLTIQSFEADYGEFPLSAEV
jgi:hypothetical protein